MQIRGSLITACLTFALVAAAGATAAPKSASTVASQLSAHRFQVAAQVADQRLAIATHKTKPKPKPKPTTVQTLSKPSTARIIYIDVPVVPSSQPYVDPNACADSGNDCTTAQLCEYWGEDCDGSTDSGQTTDPGLTDSGATDPSAAGQSTGN